MRRDYGPAKDEKVDQDAQNTEGKEPLRRNFLKSSLVTLGSGLLSGVGFSGFAAGQKSIDPETRSEMCELKQKYNSKEAMSAALKADGSETIGAITKQAELSGFNGVNLTESKIVPPAKLKEGTEGATVLGMVTENRAYAHIQINRRLNQNRMLTIVIQPELGRQYAKIKKTTDPESENAWATHRIIDPTQSEVSTSDTEDIIVTPQCHAATVCNPDCGGDSVTCADLDGCCKMQLECCNNYTECYQEIIGSCIECCHPQHDCSTIWGDCT